MRQPHIQVFVIVLITSILITGCKKEESDPQNSFKYNEKEALIGTVMSLYWDQLDINVYGYELQIFEKTLTIYYSNGYPDSLSGSGDAIVLEMHSSDASGIKPGDYIYSESESPYLANTFGLESGLYIFTDATANDNPVPIAFNSGNVNVKKNGDEYEFTFTLKTDINSTITGFYKGKIASYDEKKKKGESSAKNSIVFHSLMR